MSTITERLRLLYSLGATSASIICLIGDSAIEHDMLSMSDVAASPMEV